MSGPSLGQVPDGIACPSFRGGGCGVSYAPGGILCGAAVLTGPDIISPAMPDSQSEQGWFGQLTGSLTGSTGAPLLPSLAGLRGALGHFLPSPGEEPSMMIRRGGGFPFGCGLRGACSAATHCLSGRPGLESPGCASDGGRGAFVPSPHSPADAPDGGSARYRRLRPLGVCQGPACWGSDPCHSSGAYGLS